MYIIYIYNMIFSTINICFKVMEFMDRIKAKFECWRKRSYIAGIYTQIIKQLWLGPRHWGWPMAGSAALGLAAAGPPVSSTRCGTAVGRLADRRRLWAIPSLLDAVQADGPTGRWRLVESLVAAYAQWKAQIRAESAPLSWLTFAIGGCPPVPATEF